MQPLEDFERCEGHAFVFSSFYWDLEILADFFQVTGQLP